MTLARRNTLLGFGVMVVTLVLIFTEVADRWMEAWAQYQALRQKQHSLLDPEAMATRKLELLRERASLQEAAKISSGFVEQSSTGVVQMVNRAARECEVGIDALTPKKAEPASEREKIVLQLDLTGGYHAVGQFVNKLETAGIPVNITHLDLDRSESARGGLKARIEATATIAAGR